jgi:hypothetical protein
MHVFPQPGLNSDPLPPQFAGYDYHPVTDSYKQREGYLAFAGLTALYLDERGNATGIRYLNRGGPNYIADTELLGDYTLEENSAPGVYKGTIRLQHKNTGDQLIDNYYAFIVRNADELEWVWARGTYQTNPGQTDPVMSETAYRALVIKGTLSRVTIHP